MNSSWEMLIQRARNGETEALGELLAAFQNQLALQAKIQLRSQLREKVSESDVVQQTYINAFRGFSTFRGTTQEELAAWLRQILTFSVANQIRQFTATASRDTSLERNIQSVIEQSSQTLDKSLHSAVKSPSSVVCSHERAARLTAALQQLAPKYRDVIMSRCFDELTFPEIARKMRVSEDSVQKLWWRGISKLQHQLKNLER